MGAGARRKLLGKERKGVYHCTARCVRRAFLCGRDPVSGRNLSHRRRWIQTREEQLAALFCIEVEFRAELSNHLHVVLRTRPEIAKRLTPEEVARRWLTITRLAKCMSDEVPEVSEAKIEQLVGNKKRIAKLRKRLSSVSWFMGILQENIARRANREDEQRGRFWEGRFKCRECTNENAILICGVYVDLNPIKAGEAATPETARHTSIYQRLQARGQRKRARNRADGWMGELTLAAGSEQDEAVFFGSRTGRRASDLGILPISLEDYLKLLRWTARQLRSGQRKTVPADVEPLLEALHVRPDGWLETVDRYDALFGTVVGSPAKMAEAAARLDVCCLKGTAAARRAFA